LLKGSLPIVMRRRHPDVLIAAGYVPGIERLGVPPLRMTDASPGVSNIMNQRRDDVATALPSGLSLASTWDPALARRVYRAARSPAPPDASRLFWRRSSASATCRCFW